MGQVPRVAVVMGSDSDWPVMQAATDVLTQAGVEVVSDIVSAHRTPEKMMEFARTARDSGFHVIIEREVLLTCQGWWPPPPHFR